MPIELAVVVPLAPLTKFVAHEEQLFARMTKHPGVKHPQVGELLPFVARHLVDERTFAMHHFVVTEYENEMLLKRVEEREGDTALMKPAIDRIERHVVKEVVHPAHVPFEAEPESTEIDRPRHTGPGS